MVDQEKQGAKVASLEREYSTLTSSHRDLKDSYEKMVNREKKKDKFFKKMWKWVKVIFKFLKPNHTFPSPKSDSEDEAPTEWLDDDVDGGDVESAGEDNS